MEDREFWKIVEAARVAAGGDLDARVEALAQQLEPLPPAALQAFQARYDEKIQRSYRWDLWGAAYLMNGGCSDDGFRYFRDWLVSEGEATFERALSDPDSLAELSHDMDYYELEPYGYVALEVFESKGDDELQRDFSTDMSRPQGEPWKEEDLPKLLPRLAARYSG